MPAYTKHYAGKQSILYSKSLPVKKMRYAESENRISVDENRALPAPLVRFEDGK
jgi:hypothetical protein